MLTVHSNRLMSIIKSKMLKYIYHCVNSVSIGNLDLCDGNGICECISVPFSMVNRIMHHIRRRECLVTINCPPSVIYQMLFQRFTILNLRPSLFIYRINNNHNTRPPHCFVCKQRVKSDEQMLTFCCRSTPYHVKCVNNSFGLKPWFCFTCRKKQTIVVRKV